MRPGAVSSRGWPPARIADRAAHDLDVARRRRARRWTVASDLPGVALHARAAIADACRTLLDEAARACGSRPFARAETLDRARRDLEVFLLQHRLDPMLARAGTAALDAIDAEVLG